MTDEGHLGGCLCRGVRFCVAGPVRHVWTCHCEDCRRITGNFMAASGCATSDLHFEADGSLQWFSRQPGVEYGFCSTCGSSLFWRASDKPEHLSICAGTLDDTAGLEIEGALFRAEAADYSAPHPDVPTYAHDRESAVWSD